MLLMKQAINHLTAAKTEYEKYVAKAADDQKKANEATDLIKKIHSKDEKTYNQQYLDAQKAYDALTDDQKKLITQEIVNQLNSAKVAYEKNIKNTKDTTNTTKKTSEEKAQNPAKTQLVSNTTNNKSSNNQIAQTKSKFDQGVASITHSITQMNGNREVSQSSYQNLKLKTSKVTTNAISLNRKKVKGASMYLIYGTKCGKKYRYLTSKKVKAIRKRN